MPRQREPTWSISALFSGVEKLLLDPGDPDARPPVPPTYESNDDFRRRIQLSLEGYSTAGPSGAYEFFAHSADPTVKDVAATSPAGGQVSVVVLSTVGNGVPSDELIAKVQAALSAERIRPVCDTVTVAKAAVTAYDVTAELEMDDPPDQELVRAESEASARCFVEQAHRLDRGVSRERPLCSPPRGRREKRQANCAGSRHCCRGGQGPLVRELDGDDQGERMSDLLPPNRTKLEQALERATARLGAVPVPIKDLWNPWRCPVALLPWLAWSLSVG